MDTKDLVIYAKDAEIRRLREDFQTLRDRDKHIADAIASERERCANQYALSECTALGYATRLAIALHAKHYPEVTQWKPMPDLMGVLTQIDNMTSGLVRPNSAKEHVGDAQRAANRRPTA